MIVEAKQKAMIERYNALPPERRAADEKALQDIFSFAASRSETFALALASAKLDGALFVVDNAQDCPGYYLNGTGLIGVPRALLEFPQVAAGVIVKQIRHLWQDQLGLLPSDLQLFPTFYTNLALTEADAFAFQIKTLNELRRAMGSTDDVTAKTLFHFSDPDNLWQTFTEWFDTAQPRKYADRAVIEWEYKLGPDTKAGEAKDYNRHAADGMTPARWRKAFAATRAPEKLFFEFGSAIERSLTGGIDLSDLSERGAASVMRLDADFGGRAYFNKYDAPEFLELRTQKNFAMKLFNESAKIPYPPAEKILRQQVRRRHILWDHN